MAITYTDKVQNAVNPLPVTEQWRAVDANEVKTEVNANIIATAAAQAAADAAQADADTAQSTANAAQATADAATTTGEVQAIADEKIVQTITDGDTTHAPSADIVFETLSIIPKESITGGVTLDATAFGKIHYCSGTSANYTVVLPTAVGNEGKTICIKGDPETAVFNKVVTVDGSGTEKIDAYLTRSIARGGYLTIVARVDVGVGSWQVINYDQGDWINWTPTFVGLSGVTVDYKYKVDGKALTLALYHLTTSTGAGTTVTFTLPEGFTAIMTTINNVRIINNGGTPALGIGIGAPGSNIIQCFTTIASGTWTGVGDREVTGIMTIPIN